MMGLPNIYPQRQPRSPRRIAPDHEPSFLNFRYYTVHNPMRGKPGLDVLADHFSRHVDVLAAGM